jgi:hypothetical protein
MRRVHTTFDLLEAHIIVGMLQRNDVDAWLFDADFVRQDWFKSLAYGGYRIMVPNEATASAVEILQKYMAGQLALSVEYRLPCPACGKSCGSDDPWPRRNIFLSMILLECIAAVVFSKLTPSTAELLLVIAAVLGVGIIVPCFAMPYFKWRFRCEAWGHRWRSPPQETWAELSRAAAAAELL